MLTTLLSGNGEVTGSLGTRAQLPLLLNQLVVEVSSELDIAVETDTALTATVFIGSALIPADVAVETDTAMNLTVLTSSLELSVTPAVETDTAMDLTVASSQSAAYPGLIYPSSTTYPWSGDYIPIDLATETDTAFSLTVVQKTLFPVSVRAGNLLVPVTEIEDTEFASVTPT